MAQFSVKIIRLNGAVLDENQHSRVSIRVGSGRTALNYGVIHSRQVTEKKTTFESVSILVKGGWKETRGV
jgi:hypothetical protein